MDDSIIRIGITSGIRHGRPLPAPDLAQARDALEQDGVVMLEDAIDVDELQSLRDRMRTDLERVLSQGKLPTQFVRGHIQQDPPPFKPFLIPSVLFHGGVVAISEAILGPKPRNVLYSGNTNLPGSGEQPIHVDLGQLWKGLSRPHPASALVINVPLVDMDVGNGSTELWPGTHLDTGMSIHDGTLRVAADRVASRRKERPPVQPTVPCGSILIRDMRLWHRGMPNRSLAARPMIAMVHQASWMQAMPLEYAQGSEDVFVPCALDHNARFRSSGIAYLERNAPYDVQEGGGTGNMGRGAAIMS